MKDKYYFMSYFLKKKKYYFTKSEMNEKDAATINVQLKINVKFNAIFCKD